VLLPAVGVAAVVIAVIPPAPVSIIVKAAEAKAPSKATILKVVREVTVAEVMVREAVAVELAAHRESVWASPIKIERELRLADRVTHIVWYKETFDSLSD